MGSVKHSPNTYPSPPARFSDTPSTTTRVRNGDGVSSFSDAKGLSGPERRWWVADLFLCEHHNHWPTFHNRSDGGYLA